MGSHRKYAASSAHRWLNCTKSHALEAAIPSKTSKYAQEGTIAHDLAARMLLRKPLGKYDPAMFKYVSVYYDYISDQLKSGGSDLRVEFSADVFPGELGGTTDAVFLRKDTLHVCDFKYGQGVIVEPDNNPQLMIYALACLDKYPKARQACLTIVQPRAQGEPVKQWRCGLKTLYDFRAFVGDQIDKIEKDKTEFCRGDHCQFCKVLPDCPAYLELIQPIGACVVNKEPAKIDPLFVLNHITEIRALCDSVEKSFTEKARNGESVPGFKLVETRGKSEWAENAIDTLSQYDGAFVKKLIGITEARKLLGKEIVDPLIVKTAGGVKLVSESDKRPAAAMSEMFEEIKGE